MNTCFPTDYALQFLRLQNSSDLVFMHFIIAQGALCLEMTQMTLKDVRQVLELFSAYKCVKVNWYVI